MKIVAILTLAGALGLLVTTSAPAQDTSTVETRNVAEISKSKRPARNYRTNRRSYHPRSRYHRKSRRHIRTQRPAVRRPGKLDPVPRPIHALAKWPDTVYIDTAPELEQEAKLLEEVWPQMEPEPTWQQEPLEPRLVKTSSHRPPPQLDPWGRVAAISLIAFFGLAVFAALELRSERRC